MVSANMGGSTSSMKVLRLALLKKRSPAFLCTFHSSPSALMIPSPVNIHGLPHGGREAASSVSSTEYAGRKVVARAHLPNRSQDLDLKKSPLMKSSLFFRTCSRFLGSLIQMAGGKDGTDISYVSKPASGWTWANQSRSLYLGCRNQNPLPAKGNVPGGRLKTSRSAHRLNKSHASDDKEVPRTAIASRIDGCWISDPGETRARQGRAERQPHPAWHLAPRSVLVVRCERAEH